jgi:hypothetical protein
MAVVAMGSVQGQRTVRRAITAACHGRGQGQLLAQAPQPQRHHILSVRAAHGKGERTPTVALAASSEGQAEDEPVRPR